jgi:hypothetical protein
MLRRSSLPRLRRLLSGRSSRRELWHDLALNRDVESWTRSLGRTLSPGDAPRAEQLFPSWRQQDLQVPLPEGFFACNPSVVVHRGEILTSLRLVNYQLQNGKTQAFDPQGVVRSRNLLLRLNERAEVQKIIPLSPDDTGMPGGPFQGLEDIRLFCPSHDELWLSCTVRNRHPSSIAQIGVAPLDLSGRVGPLAIQDFGGAFHQKNWMPYVDDHGFGWVYSVDPTITLRYDPSSGQAREWRRNKPHLALDHQRGSSQLLSLPDGWLCVTHEASRWRGRYRYLHRFLELDAEFAVRALSEPFGFSGAAVEFCAGLARLGSDLCLSFGILDARAAIAMVDEREVLSRLRPCAQGCDLPRPLGSASPPSPPSAH